MKNKILLLLLFISLPAAAAPRISNVSAKEASGTEVVITVTIERPTPLDLVCSATIDPGDGGRGPTVSWDVGDRRTKTTRYDFKKPGTYTLKVSGTGNDPCGGSAQATVTVGAKGAKPAAAKAAKPACPDGWEMASTQGASFTCRVKNPTLACPEGTKYFAGKGEVGCK
ncbi:MAG TPA: PKD domain-containing protein [Burkholderiales bacterium]|nr:PKD domain-containing protein [Burkholderiales bacterium]